MSQNPGLEAALKSVLMANALAPTLRPGLKPTSPFSHMHFKGSYSFFFRVESSHRVARAQILSGAGKEAWTILYSFRYPQKKALRQGFKVNVGLNLKKQVGEWGSETRKGRVVNTGSIVKPASVRNWSLILHGETLGNGVRHMPQRGKGAGVFGDIYTPTPDNHYWGLLGQGVLITVGTNTEMQILVD